MKSKIIIAVLMLALFVHSVNAASPIFQSPTDAQKFNLTEDINFQYLINATDSDSDYPINFTDTSHDSAIGFFIFNKDKINGSVSLINFTPTNDYVGVYSFHIIATDNNGESRTINVQFNITNSNDGPNITGTSPEDAPNVPENSTLNLQANITDIDLSYGDSLNFTWLLDGKRSSKLNYAKISTNISNATYTPNVSDYDAGPHTIQVIVEDSSGEQDTYTWNVNVINVNRKPVFNETIPDINLTEELSYINHFSLADHFYDPDANGTLTEIDTGFELDFDYSVIGGNPHGINITINDSTGNVSLYPARDFFGPINVSFSVFDNYDTVYSNNITINVSNVNDPPEIENITNKTTYENTLFSYNTIASDIENDTLSYYLNSPTLPGITINSTTGEIILESQTGDAGNHTINVTVSDGLANTSELFNLEVKPNQEPTIFPFNNQSILQHSTFNLRVNGSDIDADQLSFYTNFSQFMDSRHNDTAWDFYFTPVSQDIIGNHSIRVFAEDEHGSTNYYDFVLEIIDKQMPPEIYDINIPNNQLKVGIPFETQAHAFDEEGNIHLFNDNTSLFDIVTDYNGSTTENATGNISFTPLSTGYHVINISVNDTTGLVNSTQLIINITNNRAPYFTSINNITTEEKELYEQQVNAQDPDWQDSITYGHNASPATSFSMDSNGLISFTPPNQNYYVVNIWAYDGTSNISKDIIVNATEINDAPYFTHNVSNMTEWDNVEESLESVISVNAADEEFYISGEKLNFSVDFINFTDLNDTTTYSGIDLFYFENISLESDNTTTGTINFTPKTEEVGTYWVNISVTDNNSITSAVFSFTIQNRNNEPIGNWSLEYPQGSGFGPWQNSTGEVINCTENETINIQTNYLDPDFDDLTYTWSADDQFISNSSELNYKIPFTAYPYVNLKLNVSDGSGSTIILWTLNASNVNRPITFGKKYYSFAVGKFNHTEETNGNLLVQKFNSTHYYQNSSFVSSAIDFKTTSLDIPRIMYDNITLIGNTTKASVFTDTNNIIPYDPVWNAYNETITSDDYRYFKFKLKFDLNDTTQTPNISKAIINYKIQDQEAPESTEYAAWLDLNNFFSDPDTDDNITYDYAIVNGSGGINITINQGHFAGLSFVNEGTVELVFNATDSWGSSTQSNKINITITTPSGEGTSTTTTSSSSDTDTEIQTQVEYKYREKKEPTAFDIIHPDKVNILRNETLMVPIVLKNGDEFNLNDLDINAETEREGLDLSLDKTHLDNLQKGSSSTVTLTMSMDKVYESYDVLLTVNVSDPDYDDTAKIIVSSLKKGQHDNESETMKLAFVSDLLKRNSECAELSEYITRAKEHLEAGNALKANNLLDTFLNDCKVLMKEGKQIDNPAPITGNFIKKLKNNTEYQAIAVTIGIVMIATIVVSLTMLYRKI